MATKKEELLLLGQDLLHKIDHQVPENVVGLDKV